MTISQTLLPEFDEEMKNTRKLLERVPENRFDYQPHAKSMTLGRLAGHVAELPEWAKMTIEIDNLDLQPGQQPYIAKSTKDLLSTFDKSVTEARKAISGASDEHMNKTWSLTFSGKPVFSMPRVAVLRISFMNHLIHHRAQLGVYLRLNEVEIPGMYGPSADEMKFWSAQSS
ncbi:MAG: DinB family protein [Bryobacterales bacterium]|nr:DinB family protein [Bryobacterales bacterium]